MRAVLTFHAVDERDSVLSVQPAVLRSLVRGIQESGHEIVPLGELLDDPSAPDRVALSFDDGFRSVHDAALPVLAEAGVSATLFLTTGFVGGRNDWPSQPDWAPRHEMLDWGEVEALHAAGWSIEAHTAHHPDLRTLPDDALRAELEEADRVIEERLGRRPEGFAYPYGYKDDRVVARAGERYRYAVTTELAPLANGNLDPFEIPRLDSYYLRPVALHRRFGGTPFRAWLRLRAALRSWRARA